MSNSKIPNRFFWSWDHSTNWLMNVPGEQVTGVCNGYAKEPPLFEEDYKRAIDWCAEHKMTGIGIVGMLRDRHGGIDAARRICSYAREKGTLVYMISGLFAYGGIYYEGDSKYSLSKFFEKNPDTVAKSVSGKNLVVKFEGRYGVKDALEGCASNPLLKEFVLESLDWVFREIPELGGIQMESTDNSACQCPRCIKRRGAVNQDRDTPFSIADMAEIYPDAANAVLNRNPDAIVICESYHHFLDEECKVFENAESPEMKKLLSMPGSVFWQWKCDKALSEGGWNIGDKMIEPMRKFRHNMRAHSGTQWWGGRNTFAVDKIRRQCLLSNASMLDGVSIFGESSPYHVNAEFNYLALEYFSDNPENSNDSFIEDVMAPRLGGKDKAELYFEYATLPFDEYEKIPKRAFDIAKILPELQDYEALRRWQYLSNFLNSYYWELKRGTDILYMIPRGSDRVAEV